MFGCNQICLYNESELERSQSSEVNIGNSVSNVIELSELKIMVGCCWLEVGRNC